MAEAPRKQDHLYRRSIAEHLCAAGVAVLLLAAATADAQKLPNGFFPESVARARDGSLYVGSAVAGEIVRVAPGAVAAKPFVAAGANGLMSVQGLHVDDDASRLYACTGDLGVAKTPRSGSALLAFDLRSGAAAGRWPLPEGGFCNDIAAGPGGVLFVSDTFQPRILRFDVNSERLEVWLEHPLLGGAKFNGNGIVVDRRWLYLTTFDDGRLLRVAIDNDTAAGPPEVVELPRPLAGADALRVLAPAVLLVFENDIAGGHGRVTRIDLSDGPVRLQTVADGLHEPTSGVVHGGAITIVESQFRRLFGTDKGKPPGPFALRSIALNPAQLAAQASSAADGSAR